MTAHPLPDGRVPVLLSAHDEDLIRQDAAAIAAYLDGIADTPDLPAAVSSTLLRTRRVRRYRAVVRAANRGELIAGLEALAVGDQHPLVASSSETSAPRTAFVFPGQGNQWPSMSAEVYHRLPAYRTEADRCAATFTAAGLPSPLEYLLGDADREWSQIQIQGAQFTHAVSLAEVWRSCGVLPDLTVGHSLGEVAAAHAAGTITLHDAVAVVAARATVVDRLPGRYGMAMLGVAPEDAQQLIAETPGWLELSVVNGPSSSVVSGDRDAVAAIVALAKERSIFVRELPVEFPAHTSALESLRTTLADLLPASVFLDAPVEFISSAHGRVVRPDTDFAAYWYENLRNTVRFDWAVNAALQRDAGAFAEMSAHPSLLYSLAELADGALIVGSGHRDEPAVDELSSNIAAAAVANPGYRWADATTGYPGPPLWGFPNAPMRALHLWAKPEPLPPAPDEGLKIIAETWQPADHPPPPARAPFSVAIISSEDADDALTQQLAEAVAAHPAAQLTGPTDADVAVLVAPPCTQDGAAAAINEICTRAVKLDYHTFVGPRCRRVWLVTTRGERVQPGEPVAAFAQAVLAAMHRSIGLEFPDCTFAHLDLPRPDIGADVSIVDMLFDNDTEVALRDNPGGTGELRRYVRRLRERTAPQREPGAAVLDNVVITGGSGGIGLRFARYCVEHGARRLVLLSRNGVDAADLDRLIEGHSVEIYAPPCDVTDRRELSDVAADYAGNGASLLIHAAGIASLAPHNRLGEPDLADVFGAKVAGLVHITDIWPRQPESRILLCSSVSGVWGGYGHAAYAAANRMLDVLADQLRAGGLQCTAVRWGLWPDPGILAGAEIARVERAGLIAMDPDAAIRAGLGHHDDNPLILAADFDRLQLFFESQGIPMPFQFPAAASNLDVDTDGHAGEQKPVAAVVRAELATVLDIDGPATVDMSTALVDLGVDSLLALDLRNRLRRATGRSVPLARLLGGITGVELIEELQSPPEPDPPRTLERLESSP
ncbi:Polyketide synthetase MbtD (polyketide synthase) [Mycobacterium tuberculosis H37Rv] [Mycobacterium shimoidei]|uniref:Polyketide synthetase MbtD (Polyketide synthase) [Mycobacterium tuberculosis H37Rv] n=1 Tax=Mycobacterium shimoidei TaxID=29313 RepID=A0A375Z115_MYCSH|nr:mycobactin polyketide synthase MbtD [Mycobacterium shimoidei]SRX94675.1 Polyketide synthetase MbtD (polyketide synthase) [Mycobacterium tuberculosis H37Rv] [Mycobacterium shimoidei]